MKHITNYNNRLIKAHLKNPEKHPMSSDMDAEVTIDMVHNAETLKNELAENELPLHLRTKH